MAKVVLEKVCKTYPGDVVAVQDVDLVIEDREFVVLVGPSGCGKSTTLRMIAGLEDITRGDIYIDGRKVNEVAPKNRDIAMVFQNYALYPHMSVYKNMAFGLQLRRFPRAEIDERVHEAADILGIESLLDRKPRALSGGQRQRVAVGRAIVRKPKAFLFDEPLSNLDAKLRVQMRTEISKLHTRLQSTMIYVTHDQVEAMTMGDRIVVMDDGFVKQVAPPIELYDHPANQFVAGFIGSPPMNFFTGRLEQKGGSLFFHEGNFNVLVDDRQAPRLIPYAGRNVIFGLRPEDVKLARHLPDASPDHCVRARVEVVEPMGAESIVYLHTGLHAFVVRVDAHEKIVIGKTAELVFAMDKARFFDPDTKDKIT